MVFVVLEHQERAAQAAEAQAAMLLEQPTLAEAVVVVKVLLQAMVAQDT